MITINQNENQLITLSNSTNNDINVNQNENQLLTINNSNNSNNIDINQNENQLLYISGDGNIIGISDVLVNGVTVVSNNIAYVIVPTKTSDLTNDSGFITSESDPTVPSYIKAISIADINNWNNKQNTLVSGSNIKTINNTSILGSGNIEIDGSEYSAGTGIDITSNVISNTITDYEDLNNLPTIPTKTSDLLNDNNFVSSDNLSTVAFSGSYADLSDTPNIPDSTSDLTNDSGFIDKNVNDLTNYTLSSNLSTVATSGDYDDLLNKPSIPTVNDGTLTIQKNSSTIDTFTANSSTDKTINITVPTTTSELTNDSGFITDKYEEYSTTETRIGTWIDNKPLYRQVFTANYTTTGTEISINSGISNIDKVINIKGYFYRSAGYCLPLNYYNKNTSQNIFIFYYGGSAFHFLASWEGTVYGIVEYTKTTD